MPEPKELRCAVYARVSSADQTTANQLPELKSYVAQRKWVVQGEYIDNGISGAKHDRPALNEMMAAVRKGKVDVVLVWKFDRFARSTSHLLAALEEFRQRGVSFCSITESLDTSTAMGKMVFLICSGVAELERALITERVKLGQKRARSQGVKLGRPALQIDESKVRRLRAKGMSTRAIALQLHLSKSAAARYVKALNPTLPQKSH